MADTFYVELASLVSDDRPSVCPDGLQGCVAQVRITSEMKAAILAIDRSRINRVIAPLELDAALFAIE